MKIGISKIERDTLLAWKDASRARAEHFGNGDAAFPDEESLTALLNEHEGGDMDLGPNKLAVMLSWAESAVDPNFGGGAMTNPIEKPLLDKIKAAHQSHAGTMPPGGFPLSERREDSTILGKKFAKVQKPRPNLILISGLILVGLITAALFLFSFLGKKDPGAVSAVQVEKGDYYIVDFITGAARKKHGDRWKSVKIHDRLFTGDSIMTEKGSHLVISNAQGSLRIDESRTIRLK
jgi:hypothetical protein